MKKAFHFLGCVHFAITLIGAAALFVIAGTLIESKTGSHRLAAYYTYSNPAFLVLLMMFFVNILFAALRRWPFHFHHIPFLTTHLGLLMILAGVIIKWVYGTQGMMILVEGSGSHELLLPGTEAIRIEKKATAEVVYCDLKSPSFPFPECLLERVSYSPHSTEKIETWIKGDHGVISGLPPFPVYSWKPQQPIPISGKARFLPPPHEPWNIVALRVEEIGPAAEALYKEGLEINSDTPLSLHLNFSAIQGFEDPYCLIGPLKIPLSGPYSLLSHNQESIFGEKGEPIVLGRTPVIAFIQDRQGDIACCVFFSNGEVFCQPYRTGSLHSLTVYEEGFGGYAAAVTIPVSTESKENLLVGILAQELTKSKPNDLLPPLRLLYEACEKGSISFASCVVDYLLAWDRSGGWLYSSDQVPASFAAVVPHLNWGTIPRSERIGARWACLFFEPLDPLLKKGEKAATLLKTNGWPLPLPQVPDDELLTLVTRQLIATGESGLTPNQEESAAHLLSALLRAYGVHLKSIIPSLEHLVLPRSEISLECPISTAHHSAPPLLKVEDNIPLVMLQVRSEDREERIALTYDQLANGLCWPVLEGRYLLRFQPKKRQIPYHVRLRNGRQISYPDTRQPYSFECSLLLSSPHLKHPIEKTLSMNHVYETWDGYRFYLAGISPSDETDVKKVHLIVNHDPAKYYLTYPGGAIVSLGIVLLFWFFNYKRNMK